MVIAQLVSCLPCKLEDQSSITRTHLKKKKARFGVHACNFSVTNVIIGVFPKFRCQPPSLLVKFQACKKFCLQRL